MFSWFIFGLRLAVALVKSRRHLLLENAALRLQLLVSFRLTNGVALFQGKVSLENNGGFASARSLPARHTWQTATPLLFACAGTAGATNSRRAQPQALIARSTKNTALTNTFIKPFRGGLSLLMGVSALDSSDQTGSKSGLKTNDQICSGLGPRNIPSLIAREISSSERREFLHQPASPIGAGIYRTAAECGTKHRFLACQEWIPGHGSGSSPCREMLRHEPTLEPYYRDNILALSDWGSLFTRLRTNGLRGFGSPANVHVTATLPSLNIAQSMVNPT
jgi:hypothetical protein